MFTGVVQNFMNFNAVGVIIVAMVGVGVAEAAGLVKALIRKLVIVAPPQALTYILVFVGILSSIAADAGYLVLIPLAAAAFISVGRHPLAGLAAAFAAVAAAFLVNILIMPVDGILTEITNDAIHLINPSISIDLAANVWFSIASVLMLTVADRADHRQDRRAAPRASISGDYTLGGRRRAVRRRVPRPQVRAVRADRRDRVHRAADAAAGRAAAQPRDRRDRRRLAVHEQPDRLDHAALPGLRRRLRHRRPAP